MGYFKTIKLNNFRNFKLYEESFSKNCNVFYGNNGSGKTNILESISLFGKGRGIRNDSLNKMIKINKNQFINTSEFLSLKQTYNIKLYSENSNNRFSKKISFNEDISKETLNYLNSLITFIIFLPEMDRLFLSNPSYRRNFIDKFIFTDNKNYNSLINKYKKNILERNKLLLSKNYDEIWLKKIEETIASLGMEIYKLRTLQIEILKRNLEKLNDNNQLPFLIEVKYIDSFYNFKINFDYYVSSLKKTRELDILTGGTRFGPHKSDFLCCVNQDFPAEQLSTGQQKTIVLLLILAQCNHLVNEVRTKPIILMDEVCSHLDENNRKILLKLSQEFDLQIFMTGTDKNLFSFLSTNTNYCNITN